MMEEQAGEKLKSGKFIDRYIYIPDSFIVFSKYLVLSPEDAERAQKFHFNGFFHDAGDRPADSSFKTVEVAVKEKPQEKTTAQPSAETPKPAEVPFSIYGRAVALVREEFGTASGGAQMELSRLLRIASVVREYAANVRDEALLHISRGGQTSRLEVHSVNVGVLAALLGAQLGFREMDLLSLIAGALLHDVGILFLKAEDEKAAEDMKFIAQHTVRGFAYLKSLKNSNPMIAAPALQHHERAHGNGYPQKLHLKDIEISSRVVGLCDSFDNQISFIKYGNDISIHFTKDEFLSWNHEDFDQDIYAQFLKVAGAVFSVNAPVILNDGSLAIIREIIARFPFNPVVEIVADAGGNKIPKPLRIDLRKTKQVWISRIVKKNA